MTLRDPTFFDAVERCTENRVGTGNLGTFEDSRWLLSVVLAHQPHLLGQPEGVQYFGATRFTRIGWLTSSPPPCA